MKVVIQRVKKAEVAVNEKRIGKIEQGLLVLLGITHEDSSEKVKEIVKKIVHLRIFSDENDKMNLSVQDTKGEILIVSQFTLYANCQRGNRPSFTEAANPILAKQLYEECIQECKKYGISTQTGEFGADMQITLVNDGPVTIVLEN